MILTGQEIRRQIELGNIEIDPFDPARLNPNSYNCRLGDELLVYPEHMILDTQAKNCESSFYGPVKFDIPEHGYVLRKGRGYLGTTIERTCCKGFVPIIDGRSSTGRLFLAVHVTAGYGDDGFDGRWTLEIVPLAHDVRVYPGDEILQIRFHAIQGERMPYQGRYQGQQGPVGSKGV